MGMFPLDPRGAYSLTHTVETYNVLYANKLPDASKGPQYFEVAVTNISEELRRVQALCDIQFWILMISSAVQLWNRVRL